MGQAIFKHDRHNAAVITKALKKRNGCDTVGRLPVYCSDDETLMQAVLKTPGVKVNGHISRRAIVVLVRRSER